MIILQIYSFSQSPQIYDYAAKASLMTHLFWAYSHHHCCHHRQRNKMFFYFVYYAATVPKKNWLLWRGEYTVSTAIWLLVHTQGCTKLQIRHKMCKIKHNICKVTRMNNMHKNAKMCKNVHNEHDDAQKVAKNVSQ